MAITYPRKALLRKAASRLIDARHTLMEHMPKPILSTWTVFTLNTIVCFQFLAGSYFFFTWLNPWAVYAGDWCFIVGSVLTCLISICHAVDHLREMRYFQAEADLARDDDVRDKANVEYEEKHHELMESMCFVASSVIFSGGCVLFYPHLFQDKKHQEWGEEIGAVLFIAGSFGFVLAAYWNSMAMVKNASMHEAPRVGSKEYRRRRIMSFELGLSMLGSVLFVTGSFLYRPSYATDCSHEALRKAAKVPQGAHGTTQAALLQRRWRSSHAFLSPARAVAEPHALSEDFQGLCVNVMNQGTWLYLLGSILFIVQCGLVAWRLMLTGTGEGHGEDSDCSPVSKRASTASASGEELLKGAAAA